MKRIHLIILYLVLTLGFAPNQLFAGNIVWYNGKGHVTYSIQKKHASVVDKALDMFAADMNTQEKIKKSRQLL